MDGGMEQSLAPALGGLAVAGVLLDVGDHPRIEDRLAIGLRIEPPIEIEVRAFQHQARQLGHPLQSLQPFREQHRIRFIDGCHRQGSQHIPVVVDDGDALFSLLVFVTGIADAVPAFFGHGVGPITVEHAEIKLVVVRQMLHTGDEGLLKGAVIRPLGKDFVDRRVVDGRLAMGVCRYGQAFPLHARVEHPQDQVEDAMIAEFTLGSALRHGEVREDKLLELRGGELHGNWRRCGLC